jgi:hypothetical protein
MKVGTTLDLEDKSSGLADADWQRHSFGSMRSVSGDGFLTSPEFSVE